MLSTTSLEAIASQKKFPHDMEEVLAFLLWEEVEVAAGAGT